MADMYEKQVPCVLQAHSNPAAESRGREAISSSSQSHYRELCPPSSLKMIPLVLVIPFEFAGIDDVREQQKDVGNFSPMTRHQLAQCLGAAITIECQPT